MPKSWRLLCGNSIPCSFRLSSILQGCSRFTRTLSQIASFVLTVLGCQSRKLPQVNGSDYGAREESWTSHLKCLPQPETILLLVHTLRAFQKGRPFRFSLECLTPQDQSFRTPEVQTEQEAWQHQISIPYFLFFHSSSCRQSSSPFFIKTQNLRCIWIQRGQQLDVFLNSHTASLLDLAGDTPHAHHLNGASECQHAEEERVLISMLDSGQIHSACICEGSSWSVRFMWVTSGLVRASELLSEALQEIVWRNNTFFFRTEAPSNLQKAFHDPTTWM